MPSKANVTRRLYTLLKDKIATDVTKVIKGAIKANRHFNVDAELESILNLKLLEMPNTFKVSAFPALQSYCKKNNMECDEVTIKHEVIIRSLDQIENKVYKQLKRKNPNAKVSKRKAPKTKVTKRSPKPKEEEPSVEVPKEKPRPKKKAPKAKKKAPKSTKNARLFEAEKIVNEDESEVEDDGYPPIVESDESESEASEATDSELEEAEAVEETKEAEAVEAEIQHPLQYKKHDELIPPSFMEW
jgi:hypothetical protein